jgi:DNA-binding transcriptional LysR family regulator
VPAGRNAEPLSIRQLEVFVSLLDHGSFTRAAQHLSLSQSTVSGHLADLEARLGALLVERRRDGLRATAAGQALLPGARRTLQAERGARAAVEETRGVLAGTLTIGASTIPAAHLLPPLLGRFHARHPGISLVIVGGDTEEVLDRLVHGDAEVVIVGARPEREGLRRHLLGEDALVLVAPPGHPLAARRSVPLSEVVRHPLVLRESGSGTRRAVARALNRTLGRSGAASLRVACEVGSNEMLKALVRAGIGVAFTSRLSVKDEVAAGTLVEIPVHGFSPRRRFHLVTRREDHLSPAARAFVRLVESS